jgi:hypothetical protein
MDLWSQIKRTWFQAQIKQDIAISTQHEHERHSTHKRDSYSIFYKRKAIHNHIYPKATKSIAIHLMSITRKVITSYLSYHGEQSIWEKHISMTYVTNAVYDTKMQNMIWYINENATCICISTLPTEAQKGKTTPSSPRKRGNVAWSKGLVRISTSCFSVGTWMRSMFPFSILSLRKWYLTSMCFVLEWSTRFLATLMALELSHMRGTWEHSSPKSLSVYVIQSSYE